jgi:hypothetical protein
MARARIVTTRNSESTTRNIVALVDEVDDVLNPRRQVLKFYALPTEVTGF